MGEASIFLPLLTAPGRIFYETQYAPLLQLQGTVKEVAFDLTCNNQSVLPVLVNSVQQQVNESGRHLIHSAFFDATDRRRYEQDLLHSRKRLEQEVSLRTADLEREICERQRVEEDLRELNGRLLHLRDEERRRIARELHDSVGQLLVALSMNHSRVLSHPQIAPPITSIISENVSLVSLLSIEIRTISHLLHPPMLDEVGLICGLQGYIEGFTERSKIDVELEIANDLPRFHPHLETALFRIVQECLSNIHRHSGSPSAKICVSFEPTQIRLEVRDFGRGTALSLDQLKSGVGLRGMRERVRLLRGTLEISSAQPGIKVVAVFPTSHDLAKAE